jgi:hypothetical protein
MKKINLLFSFLLLTGFLRAQQTTIQVPDNLVSDGIPALSANLVNEVKNYTEYRVASLVAWHPFKKEMLISTRFANSNQLHYVMMPGGDRKLFTFFDEPISFASFEPVHGDYFLFLRDIGGNEFSRIYRYDMTTKKTVLITDGKRSQNGGIMWNNKGDRIVYGSTRRNGQDRDIYIMDPLNPISDKKVCENNGGGWEVIGWSQDDSKLLLKEYISVNETRLYLVDLKSGNKTFAEKKHKFDFSIKK